MPFMSNTVVDTNRPIEMLCDMVFLRPLHYHIIIPARMNNVHVYYGTAVEVTPRPDDWTGVRNQLPVLD